MNVFERGTKRTIVDRTHSLTLIHKADAARAIGDLDEFAQCLENGAVIALQIGSQNRISEAVTALQRTPRKWQKEQKYQRLRKILVPGKL
jgi:hypothetical protein